MILKNSSESWTVFPEVNGECPLEQAFCVHLYRNDIITINQGEDSIIINKVDINNMIKALKEAKKTEYE